MKLKTHQLWKTRLIQTRRYVMKSIILAAGLGTRLRPITEKKPKCMVNVAGKSILQHQLELIYGRH